MHTHTLMLPLLLLLSSSTPTTTSDLNNTLQEIASGGGSYSGSLTVRQMKAASEGERLDQGVMDAVFDEEALSDPRWTSKSSGASRLPAALLLMVLGRMLLCMKL